MKSEEERFAAGYKYFGKIYEKNKKQYKEEYYLNTGIWWFVKNSTVIVFTSNISSTKYLYQVFKKDAKDVCIYYFKTDVDINLLNEYYKNSNVHFKKISKNPYIEFKHNTIVFCGNDTIVFDRNELGDNGYFTKTREVYRDKSIEHYNLYYSRAKKII
ncbi:MAG: hypothetical protein MJ214_03050 [Bacilli bacterium]|nr:hypothetical protein [Bacilli bacterium]